MKHQILEKADGRFYPQYKVLWFWRDCVDTSAGGVKVAGFAHYIEAEEYLLRNDAEFIGLEVSVVAGGLPTFYLGHDGKVSAKRMSGTDIPIWCGSSGDGWDAMKRIHSIGQQLAVEQANTDMLAKLADFAQDRKLLQPGVSVVQSVIRYAKELAAELCRAKAHLRMAAEHLHVAKDPYAQIIDRVVAQTPSQALTERDKAMQVVGIEKLIGVVAKNVPLHARFELTCDVAYNFCDELWGDDSQHVRAQYDPSSSAMRRGAVVQLCKAR